MFLRCCIVKDRIIDFRTKKREKLSVEFSLSLTESAEVLEAVFLKLAMTMRDFVHR